MTTETNPNAVPVDHGCLLPLVLEADLSGAVGCAGCRRTLTLHPDGWHEVTAWPS